eukprot:13538770-Heterocapsa_arctica.AAC.1
MGRKRHGGCRYGTWLCAPATTSRKRSAGGPFSRGWAGAVVVPGLKRTGVSRVHASALLHFRRGGGCGRIHLNMRGKSAPAGGAPKVALSHSSHDYDWGQCCAPHRRVTLAKFQRSVARDANP